MTTKWTTDKVVLTNLQKFHIFDCSYVNQFHLDYWAALAIAVHVSDYPNCRQSFISHISLDLSHTTITKDELAELCYSDSPMYYFDKIQYYIMNHSERQSWLLLSNISYRADCELCDEASEERVVIAEENNLLALLQTHFKPIESLDKTFLLLFEFRKLQRCIKHVTKLAHVENCIFQYLWIC
jgi:hypothetical protein